MEKTLFADLSELLDDTITGGGDAEGLEKVMRKHATKAQMKCLDQEAPGKLVVGKGADILLKDSVTKIVRLTGYGHKAGADQDALQFVHPNVFQYRTALFPNPRDYGVVVTIPTAKSVEPAEVANPMYKWAIDLKVVVSGPKAKRDSWLAAFENKVRVTNK